MGKLADMDRQMMLDALDRLEAVIVMAKSNFPKSTDISIRADGPQSAAMSLPWHTLKMITDAGRRALSEGDRHAR